MERYENAVWQNGTVITAASLNRIEEKLHEVVGYVIDMGSNLTTTNKIKAGKLQVGTPQTETEIGNGDALITGNIIINGTPEANNHAATKGYVDGKAINALEGITATGTLGGNGGITIGLSAATTNTLGGIIVGDKLSLTNNVLNLPIASTSAIGGIKVGNNLTIDETTGELSGNYSAATANAAGLMSSAHFTKLEGIPANATNNTGTVTGVKINNVTKNPTDGTVDIGNSIVTSIKMNNLPVTISDGEANLGTIITSHQDITSKANTTSPSFTGTASFGNNIRINSENNTVTIGSTVLSEPHFNVLYNILPQNDIPDGVYTLKLVKSTNENNEPEFIYVWDNTGGGE